MLVKAKASIAIENSNKGQPLQLHVPTTNHIPYKDLLFVSKLTVPTIFPSSLFISGFHETEVGACVDFTIAC